MNNLSLTLTITSVLFTLVSLIFLKIIPRNKFGQFNFRGVMILLLLFFAFLLAVVAIVANFI